MAKPKTPESPVPPVSTLPSLPEFAPFPSKPRHNGWSAERQRAFIAALAETGCVTRAARYVNMSTGGCYQLRRKVGAESFRRAWDAALDLGVARLKDELYERALEGQLKPVFIGGKLKGFERVKSDRLLMFALRMNARDEYGRRMAATYFDPQAPRLHAGTGVSDGGERARPSSRSGTEWAEGQPIGQKTLSPPPPAGGGLGGGGTPSSSSDAVGQQGLPSPTRITETITGPAISRARRDDINAAIVAGFDPVALSLEEIEAMQAALIEEAARRRADEEANRPENMTGVAFIAVREEDDFKALGTLEDIEPVVFEEDREAEFDEDEVRWWELE